MVVGLGSLTSSPPLTSKMWSKVSIPMAEEGAQKAPHQPTEAAAAEAEGAQKAPHQPTEEGAKQPPQQAPQLTPQQTPEAAEAEAATEAEAAALKGLRRPCFLLVSTHEPTPHALLGKKVPTRRPLPPVGNVLRLWA
jgi:hypothetical protein